MLTPGHELAAISRCNMHTRVCDWNFPDLPLLRTYSRIFRWLGNKSRIDARTAKEEGVPVWITGNFERLLAFLLVLFHVEGAFTLLALWLGAKLAASWHRLPTETEGDDEKGREHNRQVRSGTLVRSSRALSRS